MKTFLHANDLPDDFDCGKIVAIDTETMGLAAKRDRLCLVQIANGDGDAHLIQIDPGQDKAPNLEGLLDDESILKLFHFARFDVAMLLETFDVLARPVYCTKVASKLARTYTDQHGLKALVREFIGTDINKDQQSSDWGAAKLTKKQLTYAANDVIYLHRIMDNLDRILAREDREYLAAASFQFIPVRACLDVAGWDHRDIFAH